MQCMHIVLFGKTLAKSEELKEWRKWRKEERGVDPKYWFKYNFSNAKINSLCFKK